MTINRPSSSSAVTERIPWSALLLALLAALARLAVMLSIAAFLVIVLLNAVADALVYAIAGALALFLSSCVPSAAAPPKESPPLHARANVSGGGHQITKRGTTHHGAKPRLFDRRLCRPVKLPVHSE